MRRLICLCLLAFSSLTVAAQCGSPCQPVAWPLPTWPALTSPTPPPDPSGNVVPTATPTGTLSATLTPTGTATAPLDAGGIGGSLATLQFVVGGTVPPLANPSGTPFSVTDLLATAEADTTDFWGYAKGIADADFFGPFAPFATLAVVFISLLLVVKSTTFLLPIGFALFGVLRKVISLLLEFLPF